MVMKIWMELGACAGSCIANTRHSFGAVETGTRRGKPTYLLAVLIFLNPYVNRHITMDASMDLMASFLIHASYTHINLFFEIIYQPRQLPIVPFANHNMPHIISFSVQNLKSPNL